MWQQWLFLPRALVLSWHLPRELRHSSSSIFPLLVDAAWLQRLLGAFSPPTFLDGGPPLHRHSSELRHFCAALLLRPLSAPLAPLLSWLLVRPRQPFRPLPSLWPPPLVWLLLLLPCDEPLLVRSWRAVLTLVFHLQPLPRPVDGRLLPLRHANEPPPFRQIASQPLLPLVVFPTSPSPRLLPALSVGRLLPQPPVAAASQPHQQPVVAIAGAGPSRWHPVEIVPERVLLRYLVDVSNRRSSSWESRPSMLDPGSRVVFPVPFH
mmetsp:Transcript_319/g.787  ORF Transcript_319/g.787 Transcript_319/m.787 type:complete len:264 (+) Transcript_319:2486-3277(+)